MLAKYFHLPENNTTLKTEALSGITTFLTCMYVLFVNSSILAETGMPQRGVFFATALASAACTVLIALYANLPFAMAPGMGLNSIFAHTICISMGYHWKEALAIAFLSGLVHAVTMASPLRKSFVNAFPNYLRYANGASLGLFIAYVGLKNAGLISFTVPAGQYERLGSGAIIGSSSTVPGMVGAFTPVQAIAVIGLAIMIVLKAKEKKTGNQYAALPVGILAATFIGIPWNITRMADSSFAGAASIFDGFKQVFFSFWGRPGLFTVFADPATALDTLLMIFILSMTNVLSAVGTMISIGHVDEAQLFDEQDLARFKRRGTGSKLDKALIANSLGSAVSPLLGTSTATIYFESVTGISSGGRTGLTGLVVGVLFLICIPFAGILNVIPGEAVAPAVILAGASMMTQIRKINWKNFEELIPAFVTIVFRTLAYSLLDGIAVGVICHVLIQTAMGKRRGIHPVLHVISALYIILKASSNFLID